MITPAYGLTSTERVLPNMALDFTTGVLDSRVTVTRALNTATRVNSSGLVELINANLPRFDYDPTTLACKGLLIEQSTTNQIANSNDLSNASWNVLVSGTGAVTRTGNYAVAPDGTQTATRLQLSGASGSGNVALLITSPFSASAGVPESWSLWIKTNDNSTKSIHMSIAGAAATNVTATGAWQRLSTTWASPSAGSWNGRVGLVGGSGSSTDADISVWGGQMEQLAFMTSLVPTTTAGTVRNADAVSMTGTNFSSWYNATEGTLLFEGSVFVDQGATTVDFIQISNGVSNAISIDLAMFGVAIPFFSVGNSGSQCNIDTGTLTLNTVFKMVGAYKANSFAAALNGGTPGTDNAGTIPTVSQMGIGNRLSGPYMNGHARKFAYWPQRLINAEVQAFSK